MDLADEAKEVAGKLGGLAHRAPEPEDTVLADNARIVRWAGPAFALFTVILLPWTIYLGFSLPSRQLSTHYDVAWAGFDVLLMVALASTAYFALRRSRYLAPAATATATLLVVDAWFDVMTSSSSQLAQSVILAVLIELPLAGVCGWLSYHTEHLEGRRMILLLGRSPDQQAQNRS